LEIEDLGPLQRAEIVWRFLHQCAVTRPSLAAPASWPSAHFGPTSFPTRNGTRLEGDCFCWRDRPASTGRWRHCLRRARKGMSQRLAAILLAHRPAQQFSAVVD
jgi:hypothetical protein